MKFDTGIMTPVIRAFAVFLVSSIPIPLCSAEQEQKNPSEVQSVSIVNLVADPTTYQGQEIVVSGFFWFGFGQQGLYLAREHAEYGMVENSVAVFFDEDFVKEYDIKRLHGNYVVVVGVFDFKESPSDNRPPRRIQHVSAVGFLEKAPVLKNNA